MKNICPRLIVVALFGVFLAAPPSTEAATPVDPQLNRITVPILTNDGAVVMAASFEYAAYSGGGDGIPREEFDAAFQSMPEEQRLKHPEYILIRQFDYTLEENAQALYELWDPESRADVKGGIDGVREDLRKPMSKGFGEAITAMRLLSKSRFGNYARIDYELTLDWPNREPAKNAYSSYYVEQDGRFYRTKAVTRTSLFGVAVDLATKGDDPAINHPLDPRDLASMKWIATNGEYHLKDSPAGAPPPALWTRVVTHYRHGDAAGQPLPDPSDRDLIVCHNLELAPRAISVAGEPASLGPIEKFIRDAQLAYQSRDEAAVLALWSEKERPEEQREIAKRKADGTWESQEHAQGLFGVSVTVQGVIPTDDGTIVLFGDSASGPLALYVVKDEAGKSQLSRRLGAGEGERIFQNQDFCRELAAQSKGA